MSTNGIAKIVAASGDEKTGAASAASSHTATFPFGTPDYAAPEQREGNGDERHSDPEPQGRPHQPALVGLQGGADHQQVGRAADGAEQEHARL